MLQAGQGGQWQQRFGVADRWGPPVSGGEGKRCGRGAGLASAHVRVGELGQASAERAERKGAGWVGRLASWAERVEQARLETCSGRFGLLFWSATGSIRPGLFWVKVWTWVKAEVGGFGPDRVRVRIKV